MNFLTENDSTFRLPLVFDFLFQQDIPYWLKVIYISTGTFPSLTNPKGNLTPVKECASLFSVFMNPKFCINEAQPSTLKKFNIPAVQNKICLVWLLVIVIIIECSH